MMKVGFDLDGTLDKLSVRKLLRALLEAECEVHIITGVFSDDGATWQDDRAKCEKLRRLGIDFTTFPLVNTPQLHILHSLPPPADRDLRLADLGLRKGELCERLGLDLFIDDSDVYCAMIPRMSGDTTVLQVK